MKCMLAGLTLALGTCSTINHAGSTRHEDTSRGRETTTTTDRAGSRGAPASAGELASTVVAFWPLASQSYEKDPHHFGFGIGTRGGVARFVQNHLRPAVEDLGYKRLCVHLPLGKQSKSDGRMGVDAPDDLAESGREWIVDEWVRALESMNARYPDVEVIVYLGSHDRDMKDALDDGRYWEHFDRMWRGVKPFLDLPNVSIVFDNAVAWPEDHPFSRVVQLCRWYKDRQGRLVGVEASPQLAHPWTKDYAVFSLEGVWQQQRHRRNFSRDQLTGEVFGILDGYPRTKKIVENQLGGDWLSAAALIHADQRTPVIQIFGGPFEDMPARRLASEIMRRQK